MQIGLPVAVVDDGVHQVAADDVADHVDIVGLLDIVVDYVDVGHMVVIPVGVAVEPESGPVEWTGMYVYPYDGVHVDESMMMGMVEVWRGMHRTVGGRHGAGPAGPGVSMTGLWIDGTSACRGSVGVLSAPTVAIAYSVAAVVSSAIAATVAVHAVVAATMVGRVVDVSAGLVGRFAVHAAVIAGGRRSADGTSDSRLAAVHAAGVVAVRTVVLDPAGIVRRVAAT